MREISILLGAGFSIPKGYPSGARLNEIISTFNTNEWTIGTAYELVKLEPGEEDLLWYSSHNVFKHFLHGMIQFYADHFPFDYEEFYDFLKAPLKYLGNNHVTDFNAWFTSFGAKYNRTDINQLTYNTLSIYNKLIAFFIEDSEGNRYYEPIHYCKPAYPRYTGFLNLLENLGSEYDTVHIHSLNHDLFFESFNSSDWIQGELGDGFVELGSPYYGTVEGFKKIEHKVRLPYYSGQYTKKYRLYKLHGSLDYIPFHGQDGAVEAFIKTYPGIRYEDFYKEVRTDSGLSYHNDWVNIHSDFLSGMTSKVLRYQYPIFYKEVFGQFERNLSNSERLLVFGYGCKDAEINSILTRNLSTHKRSPLIFDPFPTGKTVDLRQNINGRIIPKKLEDVSEDDLKPTMYLKSLK